MALIVTRRAAETLCVGEDVEITVLGIKGNQVRLAITAPKNVRVDRKEIRIKKDTDIANGDAQEEHG